MRILALLLALLAASYLGGALVARRGRGTLASGAGWLALGAVLGPQALGLMDGPVVAAFRLIAAVAVGWVALAVGLEFGWVGGRRIRLGALLLGTLGSLACGVAVAAAVGGALAWLEPGAGFLARPDDLVLALGTGAALADTGRDLFRWGAGVAGARGPLADLLAEVGDGDDLAPVALAAAAFAVAPGGVAVLAPAARVGVEAGLGIVLGGLAAALLGSDFRRNTVLGVLFGTSLVALGLAAQLGLSWIGAGFLLGVVLSLASRHREELRALALEVERPVVLPALILAGAMVDPRAHPRLLPLLVAALGARLLAKGAQGALVVAAWPAARRGGGVAAGALAASGPLGVAVGVAFALRFPGPVGGTVLAAAVASALAGELVATPSARAALRAAGELRDEDPPAEAGAAQGGRA
ncbi:MAG TPA: hypothetical protein VML50_11465 [Anaeromyxobacter sp.]|nr:hypothetical protein [Anaeromyxobacter sp.]